MELLKKHSYLLKQMIHDFKSGDRKKVNKASLALQQHNKDSFNESSALRLLSRQLLSYQTHIRAAMLALDIDRKIYPDSVPDTAVEYRVVDNLARAQEDAENIQLTLNNIMSYQEGIR